MVEGQALAVGTRVRLRAPHWLLALRADTGAVVRPDDLDDYYIVYLDEPALYHHTDGRTEELSEIREAADNMDVLTDEA